jgi:hypothetical protein
MSIKRRNGLQNLEHSPLVMVMAIRRRLVSPRAKDKNRVNKAV